MAWYSFASKSTLYLPWRVHVALAIGVCLLAQRPRVYANGIVALCIFKAMELYVRFIYSFVLRGTGVIGSSANLAWGILRAQRLLPGSCAGDARNSILWYEGNIGAGKTTIVAHYEHCGGSTVHRERVPADLLAEFQRSPDQVGMRLQMAMHTLRTNALATAVAVLRLRRLDSKAKPLRYVYDRALVGCLAFALWNFVRGSLTQTQIESYLATSNAQPLQTILDALHDVPLDIVLLPTSIGECRKRLLVRETVDSATKESYLAGISLMHATVLASLCRLLRSKKKSPNVRIRLGDTQQDLRDASSSSVSCPCTVVRRTRMRAFTAEHFPIACELDEEAWARYTWICDAAHLTQLDRDVLRGEHLWLTELAAQMNNTAN